MKFSSKVINQAYQQIINESVLLSDEDTGARLFTALEKAMINIEKNKTIEFGGYILKFVSMDSGKTRYVTIHGCSIICECKRGISYHKSMFDILHRAYQIDLAASKPKQITGTNLFCECGNYAVKDADYCRDCAPYLPPSSNVVPMKIGGYRI